MKKSLPYHLVFLLLLFCGLMFTSACSSNLPRGLLDSAYTTHKVPADYLKVLHIAVRKDTLESDKLDFLYSTQSKFRNPISCFTYDKKYFLQIYKMDSLTEKSLNKNIAETYTDFDNTINTPYSLDNTCSVEYLFKLTKPARPLKIFLKINGADNQVLMKNDTIAYYYSRLKRFAIIIQKTFLILLVALKEEINQNTWIRNYSF